MKLLQFAENVGKLKNVKRTGWLNHKIPNPESVAEHSYRMAMLAMVLAPTMSVDQGKVIMMSLIHDLGEVETGDLVGSVKNVEQHKTKYVIERRALVGILSLGNAENFISLYDEYVENKTKEAQFVKQIDKLETAIQAYEYEKKYNMNLQEFFEYAESRVHDPIFIDALAQITALRKS
jgi:5'-deoxynucleotidase YfbR-like HD superfamily hydrolase